MLLSANFGALKGYLIGAAAFWGFVFVLTVIWVFGLPGTPALTGPKGTDPSFKQFQLNSSVAARYTAAQQFQGAASNGWKEEPVEPVGGAKLPTDQETLRADLETAKQAIQQDLITDFNKDVKESSKELDVTNIDAKVFYTNQKGTELAAVVISGKEPPKGSGLEKPTFAPKTFFAYRDPGADRIGRAGRRRGAGRSLQYQDGQGPGRRPGDNRRPVRGGQGAHGRLPDRRVRQPRARHRDRRTLAERPVLRDGGAADHGHLRRGDVSGQVGVEDLLRELAPRVLCALVRRYGHFDACEDAVQEALLAAATGWPEQGLPDNPRAWLITVASRRLTDQLRSEASRKRREAAAATLAPVDQPVVPAPGDERPPDQDDTLTLLFL